MIENLLQHQSSYNPESRRILMRRLIKVAMAYAIPIDEVEKITNEDPARLEAASVHADDLGDFHLAMQELDMPEHEIMDILAHENAHANKAEQLGAIFSGYKILMQEEKNGMIRPNGRMILEFPSDWSDDKCDEVLEKVLQAPEEYDNKLSPGDREDLEKLKKNK